MVKDEVKKAISKRLMELCEEHGVSANLDVRDSWDDECDVRIPKEIANGLHEQVASVCEGLRQMDCIKNIYDRGATRVIRGDDYRQFEITVKDGCWTHTKADEEAEEDEMRQYFDKDYARELEAKRIEERKKNWKEYLIPLPAKTDNPNTELYLTMAYEPYDWIRNGEKKTEFRSYTENYAKRLLSHPIKTVKFQRGYGGPGRPKPDQMVFEVKSITLYDMQSKMECDPFNPKPGIVPTFFAINLGKKISEKSADDADRLDVKVKNRQKKGR